MNDSNTLQLVPQLLIAPRSPEHLKMLGDAAAVKRYLKRERERERMQDDSFLPF